MHRYIGQIWLSLAILALVVVIGTQGGSLKAIKTTTVMEPFLAALRQLGILYIVALFVERSLEVLMKAWRQGGKVQLEAGIKSETDPKVVKDKKSELEQYRAQTQRRALLVGLTFGLLVSLSGVRLLGSIFVSKDLPPFQLATFQFTDIMVTAGLIAGGSSTIHELMALIDDFLKESRKRAKE